MTYLHYSPGFVLYVLTTIILCANLVFLWIYSGVVRAGKNGAINEENPPEVSRVLRAHQNAEAIIYPFLFLGLLFTLMRGPLLVGATIFGVFVVTRIAHSYFYLNAKQPWRSIAFSIGLLALIVLTLDILWMIV
jgi:prostaglandin-E synthase 1